MRFSVIVVLTLLLIWLASYIFIGAISTQIIINFRKNPPTIVCPKGQLEAKKQQQWERMADYEFLFLEDRD